MKPPLENLSLGQMLNRRELASLPQPRPLIEGWVDLGTANLVVGATGSNKTFMLLGWACAVATGTPWLGHAVAIDPAPVIYVVGEGGSGLHSRICAWEREAGVKVSSKRLFVLLLPETIRSPTFWEELSDLALVLKARLVVLDTFSSLAPEADETTDAARVLRHMAETAQAIDGAVVLAHHTGWGPQDRARGASQFEANVDGTVILKKVDPDDDNSLVEVWRKKNKDGPNGRRLYVARREVEGSCVLEPVDAPPSATERNTDALMEAVRSVLCSVDPFTLTKEQVVSQVGGAKTRARKTVDGLLAKSMVLEEHRPRTEGKRQVTRPLLAWNDVERVVVPISRRTTSRGPVGGVEATPPSAGGGVDGAGTDEA